MNKVSDNVVEFDAVTVCHGRVEVLRGVSFSLIRGHIFGFLGPNGAGKTTTIYTMLGLLEASEGRCSVSTKRIGFVLDKQGLLDDLTLYENLKFFYGLSETSTKRSDAQRIKELINSVSLDGCDRKLVKTFSTGMKKRGELARALLIDPELLILDEPTSGLDPVGQVDFRELIKRLAVQKQCTVFIASHNLSEIEAVCDEFAVIDGGRIKTEGSIGELRASGKSLEEVYLEMVRS